jgi:tryptophanyl-tRNA synthetase
MRPTGALHLGNYFGALENWVKLQDEYDCYFFIADWHALTTGYEDTADIKDNINNLVIDYISAGLDPERCNMFLQSSIKEHAELHLLFSMSTPLSCF